MGKYTYFIYFEIENETTNASNLSFSVNIVFTQNLQQILRYRVIYFILIRGNHGIRRLILHAHIDHPEEN